VDVHQLAAPGAVRARVVREAIRERAIDYPVVVDNDYAIWDAFANRYWPALYFVDADGVIRDQHFGEGRYEQSERVIQRLLAVERELVSVEGASGRLGPRRSCSTTRAGASPSGSMRATRISCCLAERESRFPPACSSTATAPGPSHGVDVDADGTGLLRDGRMYQLVRQHGPFRDRTLKITFLEPGVEAYAFTFG
jgi:hypothetical protein